MVGERGGLERINSLAGYLRGTVDLGHAQFPNESQATQIAY